MALTQGSKITWSDINTMYSNLNKATTGSRPQRYGGRSLFGFSAVSIPFSQGEKCEAADINLLNTFISEMSSNAFLSGKGLGYGTVSAGTQMTPAFLVNLQSDISTINNTCVFDTSFFSSCNGFNSVFFSSCNGFNFIFFSACDAFCFSYCPSEDFCFTAFNSCVSNNSSDNGTAEGSCFGACWGQCFIFSGYASCFGFSGGFGTCFSANFSCSEFGAFTCTGANQS